VEEGESIVRAWAAAEEVVSVLHCLLGVEVVGLVPRSKEVLV